MKILVINGPNLNMLGIREPAIYGSGTYAELLALIRAHAEKTGWRFPSSNPTMRVRWWTPSSRRTSTG